MMRRMGSQNLETDFTLADRSKMKYSVLVGRRALTGKFLVQG